MRFDDRYIEAAAALQRAQAAAPSSEARRLIQAEQARLAYYLGDFRGGLHLATGLTSGGRDLAASRAGIAASANLMALNRANEARSAVMTAQLGFRSMRVRGDDLADGLIQLAHVEAHIGDHRVAADDAAAALRITTRDPDASRLHSRALCASGFALSYGGREEALAPLLEAERLERSRGGAIWHWALFCVATLLRDRGDLHSAGVWLARSGVTLRYERAWFAVRAGDTHSIGGWLRPPFAADERPFFRALVGATRLKRSGSGAIAPALRAANEFTQLGMHHWSWGARWIAAADSELPTAQRVRMVGDVLTELAAHSTTHWALFDPVRSLGVLRLCQRHGLKAASDLTEHLEEWSALPRLERGGALASLSLLSLDGLASLREARLTVAEVHALTTALELWLETGDASRRALAAHLGISENSVRSLVTAIRRKLQLEGRRGLEPIVAWLADRELLTPTTAIRMVRRLAGPRG